MAQQYLNIYTRQMKTRVHIKTCNQMFTAALFILAKNQKELTQPFLHVDKFYYSHTTEYYSATESHQLLMYETMWMDTKRILLRKRRKPQNTIYTYPQYISKNYKYSDHML